MPLNLCPLLMCSISLAPAAEPAVQAREPAARFTRLIAHWTDYANPDYLRFVEESRGKRGAGRGVQDERPLAVEGISVDLALPIRERVARVLVSSPETPQATAVEYKNADGRLQFTMPKFLVYSIARIQFTR